jgi:hypothetical protein
MPLRFLASPEKAPIPSSPKLHKKQEIKKMATVEEIRALLLRNPKAVDRAIVVLFERQTPSEQDAAQTSESNGRGFNAFDAERGTYWAKWILSGRSLSGSHLDKARKMSLKYVKQLKEAADIKASHPAAV